MEYEEKGLKTLINEDEEEKLGGDTEETEGTEEEDSGDIEVDRES